MRLGRSPSGTVNASGLRLNSVTAGTATSCQGQLLSRVNAGPKLWDDEPYNASAIMGHKALFELEGGTTVYSTIAALEAVNLGLQNMGGAAWQTIAGYSSTSTHGAGLK